jgi:nitronate monooxygenase
LYSTVPPTRASTGEIERLPLYAGQSVGVMRRVAPAAAIVAELTREAALALSRAAALLSGAEFNRPERHGQSR